MNNKYEILVLTSLEKLIYAFSECEVLPLSLKKLTQLEELNLSGHRLDTESISVIGDIVSLRILNLRECKLEGLPDT